PGLPATVQQHIEREVAATDKAGEVAANKLIEHGIDPSSITHSTPTPQVLNSATRPSPSSTRPGTQSGKPTPSVSPAGATPPGAGLRDTPTTSPQPGATGDGTPRPAPPAQ